MTVAELESRITMRELYEWAVVSRMEGEEREDRERKDRVARQAQANRRA